MEARAERLSKYHGTAGLHPEVDACVAEFIVRQLVAEHPHWFWLDSDASGRVLHCALTGETLAFDSDWTLADREAAGYVSALDALAAQIPEDLAIVQADEASDTLAMIHVTAPSYWAPEEKLGHPFVGVHRPVAGMEALNRTAPTLMAAMTKDARYQRFAWSITTDTQLNHHPDPPSDWNRPLDAWRGRAFDRATPDLYVRVERQTLIGFRDVSAFLFTIRTYFVDCGAMGPELRRAFRDALLTMTPATLEYKGITHSFDDIIEWLGVD